MRRSERCVLIYAVLIVLAGSGASAGQRGGGADPSPVVTEGAGVVSGVVIDGATRQPIHGAVVSISGIQSTNAPLRGTRQMTDEKGRFAFTRLPGGIAYALTASKLGYFDGGFGRRGSQGSIRRITLTENQWFPDAIIYLERPASISGAVVDEAGEAVVAVLVRAYVETLVGGVAHAAASVMTTTDDRGMYRLANLTEGRYVVLVPSVQHAVPAATSLMDLSGTTPAMVASAETAGRELPVRRDPLLGIDRDHRLAVGPYPAPPPASGGRPQAYPPTYYPSARSFAEAEAIRIRSGEDRLGVDFRLQPVPTSRIAGRLAGPADAIGGITVRLLPIGSDMLGAGSETATALTAASGAFTFLNVPNGRYVIIAAGSISEYEHRVAFAPTVELPQPPGQRFGSMSSSAVFSAPSGTMFRSSSSHPDMKHYGRQPVTVADADVTDVVVAMNTGVSISGRIDLGPGSPSAGPERPSAVAGGFVRVEPANGDPTLGQVGASARGLIGDSAEFTIVGLQAGQYLLRVVGSRALKSITWNGEDYTDKPFDTSAGRDITDVVISLTTEQTTINGVVRDRAGQVQDDAAVIYFPVERAQWTNFGIQPSRLRSVAASTTGAFTLRSLPAGDYYLIAVGADQIDAWKDPAFLAAAAKLATKLAIDWGDAKTQDLVLQQVR